MYIIFIGNGKWLLKVKDREIVWCKLFDVCMQSFRKRFNYFCNFLFWWYKDGCLLFIMQIQIFTWKRTVAGRNKIAFHVFMALFVPLLLVATYHLVPKFTVGSLNKQPATRWHTYLCLLTNSVVLAGRGALVYRAGKHPQEDTLFFLITSTDYSVVQESGQWILEA